MSYEVNGVMVESCEYARDLEIIVDSRLNFSQHIDFAIEKARDALFTIFRNICTCNHVILTKLYTAYVVPHLEYCSQIWPPTRVKDLTRIENVQRIFSRIVFHRCFRNISIQGLSDYHRRIQVLSLQTLKHGQIASDLVFCYRILHKQIDSRASEYWIFMHASTS